MAGAIIPPSKPVNGAVTVALHLDSTATDSDMLDVRGFNAASILVDGTITTLTYWASHDGVTFWPMYDKAVTAVTQTVVKERWYAMPDAVFSFAFVRIVTNADGNGTVVLKKNG